MGGVVSGLYEKVRRWLSSPLTLRPLACNKVGRLDVNVNLLMLYWYIESMLLII